MEGWACGAYRRPVEVAGKDVSRTSFACIQEPMNLACANAIGYISHACTDTIGYVSHACWAVNAYCRILYVCAYVSNMFLKYAYILQAC